MLASVAEPTETVEVNYAYSTHDYDYISLHTLEAKNTSYLTRSRLTQETGITTINMPDTEGTYEVRLLNSENETIAAIGTVFVGYDHIISVNALDITTSGEEVDIAFEGSTDDYDYINLYTQQSANRSYLTRTRLTDVADGTAQLTPPMDTGIYDVRMTNSGTKTISNNNPALEITPSTGLANTNLIAPAEGGAYEVRLLNQADQTLATAKLLHVIDSTGTAVHGPVSVRAGDTKRFSYSGSTGDNETYIEPYEGDIEL